MVNEGKHEGRRRDEVEDEESRKVRRQADLFRSGNVYRRNICSSTPSGRLYAMVEFV